MLHDGIEWRLAVPLIIAVTAVTTSGLIAVLMPALSKYALARPNARSSHKVPTPQGGGIAIVAVVVTAMLAAILVWPGWAPHSIAVVLMTAMLVLGVLGAVDDIVTLRALPRLAMQLGAAAAVLFVLPDGYRVLPGAPLLVERAMLVLALTWFINLTNFMDGLDWLTVVEVAPVSAGLVLLAALGEIPAFAGVVAAALLGSTLGFAPFNRPVARLFLGDVGSLPIGLVLGWLLIVVAASGYLAAAVVMPLYYLADATITLVRRLARGERVWEAHRTHFYQRATDNGFSVPRVVGHVLALNVVLVGVAIVLVHVSSRVLVIAGVIGAGIAVAFVLARFSARRT